MGKAEQLERNKVSLSTRLTLSEVGGVKFDEQVIILCEIFPANAAPTNARRHSGIKSSGGRGTLSMKVISAPPPDRKLQICVQVGDDGEYDDVLEHNFKRDENGDFSSRAMRLEI